MSAVGDLFRNVYGGITGSNKAGEAQVRAAQKGMAISKEQFEATQKNLQPFMHFGTGFLPQLGETMAPLDRKQELQAYYQSPEFNMMSDVARGQQLAAAEATGGLGSTTTGNVLASIAPQLGQKYLGSRMAEQTDLYNRLMGGVNVGLGAATSTGASGQQYSSQASDLLAEQGAAEAGAALAPFQTLMQIGKTGASAGGMF